MGDDLVRYFGRLENEGKDMNYESEGEGFGPFLKYNLRDEG